VPDAAAPRLSGLRGVSFQSGDILCIDTQLARHKHDRQKQAVLFAGGRRALTRARVVERFGDPACATLLDCWLETGRTHQIRAHMAYAGHGLVGDPVYGRQRRMPSRAIGKAAVEVAYAFHRQALHAATLGFVHPASGSPMQFEAPVPEDMENLIRVLRS